MTWLIGTLMLALVAPSDPMEPITEALQRDDAAAAIERLEEIRQERPEEFRLNNLGYLRAVLLERLDQRNEAIAAFAQLAGAESVLSPHSLLHLIELTKNQGLSASQEYFETFLDTSSSHPLWPATALDYGRRLRREKEFTRAKLWVDRLWKSRRGGYSRRAALEHALIHLDQGERKDAITDLRKIIAQGERDDAAYQAARELYKLERMSDLWEEELRRRLRVFMNNRRIDLSRKYLEHLIASYPKSLSRDYYFYSRGRNLVLEGNFRKAVQVYEKTYLDFPDSTWGLHSKYVAGNTALRALDYPEAARHYRELIDAHPDNRYLTRAYFNLADTQRWLNQPETAHATLQEALAKVPAKERNTVGYSLARAAIEEQQFAEALRLLEPMEPLSSQKLPPGVTREEIYYWKGWALLQQGESEEAVAAFAESARGRPNYFAFAAKRHVPVNDQENSEDSPWLARLVRPRPYRTAVEPTRGKQAVIRELLFLGLPDEAALEIKRAGSAAFDGDGVSYHLNLAHYAQLGGLPNISIAAAEQLQSLAFSEQHPSSYPRFIQSLIYPRHYWEHVARFGLRYDVDPELVLSVIRQESRFQADAKSPASARGLMQFMMGTARQLSRELDLEAPAEHDLYRPHLSVQLGSYYLRKLIDRFDGSLEMALAAYNGGADNVRRWKSKLRDDSPELFVANIGFRETKLYVLKVLGNYQAYRSIYPRETAAVRTTPGSKSSNQ